MYFELRGGESIFFSNFVLRKVACMVRLWPFLPRVFSRHLRSILLIAISRRSPLPPFLFSEKGMQSPGPETVKSVREREAPFAWVQILVPRFYEHLVREKKKEKEKPFAELYCDYVHGTQLLRPPRTHRDLCLALNFEELPLKKNIMKNQKNKIKKKEVENCALCT